MRDIKYFDLRFMRFDVKSNLSDWRNQGTKWKGETAEWLEIQMDAAADSQMIGLGFIWLLFAKWWDLLPIMNESSILSPVDDDQYMAVNMIETFDDQQPTSPPPPPPLIRLPSWTSLSFLDLIISPVKSAVTFTVDFFHSKLAKLSLSCFFSFSLTSLHLRVVSLSYHHPIMMMIWRKIRKFFLLDQDDDFHWLSQWLTEWFLLLFRR